MAEQTGLITRASRHDAAETALRLRAAVASAGLTVFAEIDHRRNAQEVGMSLRPTLLMIFGAARGGTPLMQASQTAGIDLPLKALIWEDEQGKAWLSYNDPEWIAARHGLGAAAAAAVAAMAAGLARLAEAATA
jgi:uncharacterized protein (DUF302 family)